MWYTYRQYEGRRRQPWEKSYTLRIFCLLFAVLLAVLCAAGTLIYVFARQTVGEEFLRLNNAGLEGTAASMGKFMTEIRSFGQQLSVDSSLLTLADGGTMENGRPCLR